MRVAEVFGKLPSLGNLDGLAITGEALYLLSGANGSDAAREEAIEKAKQGKTITLKEAQEIIAVLTVPEPGADSTLGVLGCGNSLGELTPNLPRVRIPDSVPRGQIRNDLVWRLALRLLYVEVRSSSSQCRSQQRLLTYSGDPLFVT